MEGTLFEITPVGLIVLQNLACPLCFAHDLLRHCRNRSCAWWWCSGCGAWGDMERAWQPSMIDKPGI